MKWGQEVGHGMLVAAQAWHVAEQMPRHAALGENRRHPLHRHGMSKRKGVCKRMHKMVGDTIGKRQGKVAVTGRHGMVGRQGAMCV